MQFLVRYGEIGLKSPYVVRQLTDRLVGNIQDLFQAAGLECSIRREHGRIFVGAGDQKRSQELLARAFGVVSFSPVTEVPADLDSIAKGATSMAKELMLPGESFAIRARRAGNHRFTSQDVARRAGAAIQQALGAPVDLDGPHREIHVEVRRTTAYLYSELIQGPGGLPLGSQGKVAALVDGPRGMVAAWLMMRRGCRVLVGYTGDGKWVEPLRSWDINLRATPVADLQGLMSEARRKRLQALAVGWSAEEAIAHPRPSGLTLFHPLVGMPLDEVEVWVKRIDLA